MEELYRELCQFLPSDRCKTSSQGIEIIIENVFVIEKFESIYRVRHDRGGIDRFYTEPTAVIYFFTRLWESFKSFQKLEQKVITFLDIFGSFKTTRRLGSFGIFSLEFEFRQIMFIIYESDTSNFAILKKFPSGITLWTITKDLINYLRNDLLKLILPDLTDYLKKELLIEVDEIVPDSLTAVVHRIVNQQTDLFFARAKLPT